MEDKMKNLQDKMNKTVLKEIRFEEKHKQNVLRKVGHLNKTSNFERTKKHRYSLGKKITYSVCSALLLFTLLIGSAFVSPAMARMLSEIPYLSYFLNQEDQIIDIERIILDVANKEDYDIWDIQVSKADKEIILAIRDPENKLSSLQNNIRKSVNDALQSENLGPYSIKIQRYEEDPLEKELNAKQDIRMAEVKLLSDELSKELKKQNFNILELQVNYTEEARLIKLEVPDTENQIEEIKEEINKVIQSEELDSYKIEIDKINLKIRELEQRWKPITNVLERRLQFNEDYKINLLSFSFESLPVTFTINTSVKSSDSDAKEYGNMIEREIKQYIKSDESYEVVKNDPYKIIVYSEDKKKIN
ncbi:DUF4030 domain-containing protein [Peribacillus butanolivorans]|uniref:DUF4030 domain-containing protein n=1 Tax=Peribacillus butanolivorans TaxID=421767 RepID=UPI0036D7C4DB